MKYTPRGEDSQEEECLLYNSLEPIARGLGLGILELSLFRPRAKKGAPGTVQIKVTACKDGSLGVDDCSRLHRAILPRLELAFPGRELYLEVSSPGINRLIKDGSEFVHFIGRGVKCYWADAGKDFSAGEKKPSVDGSGWIEGILKEANEKGVTLETREGKINLAYEVIAKAKLDEAIGG